MPLYTYACSQCLRTETQIVSIADRDKQTCTAPILVDSALTADGGLRGTVGATERCGGRLVREEIEVTARMSTAWRP